MAEAVGMLAHALDVMRRLGQEARLEHGRALLGNLGGRVERVPHGSKRRASAMES
jgi:hypothetical protein